MYVYVYILVDDWEFSALSYGVLWLPTLACQMTSTVSIFHQTHQQVCPTLDGYSEPLGDENLKLGNFPNTPFCCWLQSELAGTRRQRVGGGWREQMSQTFGESSQVRDWLSCPRESGSLNGFSWPAVFTEVGSSLTVDLSMLQKPQHRVAQFPAWAARWNVNT